MAFHRTLGALMVLLSLATTAFAYTGDGTAYSGEQPIALQAVWEAVHAILVRPCIGC
jgi:hypothetical protein